ncbi:MSCRAMM family protein [Cellulomonas soli]|uniref:MSCRAMM family protein n=1 Tax=Cellulomonas soli TaxID=931535 RepID=UPI003F828769
MSSAGAWWASWMVRLVAVVGAFCLLVTVAAGSPARAHERHASAATGGKIVGRITDTARHGVAGARIEVLELLDPDGETRLVASATTGKDGRYAATAVPAGTYRVHVVPRTGSGLAAQYQPAASSVLEGDEVVVRAGRTVRHVDGVLPPESMIVGFAQDASGAAVPGIQVTVELFRDGVGVWLPTGTATTSVHGTYTVRSLPAGTYRIGFTSLATPPAFSAQYYPGAGTQWQAAAVEVGPGQAVTGIDATLTAPARITGTVTDEQGLVVPGTHVTASVEDGGYFSTVAQTTTAEDGTYVIDGLAPGAYQVSFAPPPSGSYSQHFYPGVTDPHEATTLAVTAGAHLTGIDVVFRPWDWGTDDPGEEPDGLGALSGTITDLDGLPLTGIGVTVFRAAETEVGVVLEYAGYASTTADGTYTIGLADGTYRLCASDMAGAYVSTCFPAVPDLESAVSVGVVDGAVVSGLDLRLATTIVPTP